MSMSYYSEETLSVILTVIEHYPKAIQCINVNKIPEHILNSFLLRHPEQILYVPNASIDVKINALIKSGNSLVIKHLQKELDESNIELALKMSPHIIYLMDKELLTLEQELLAFKRNTNLYSCVRTDGLLDSEENYKKYPDNFVKLFLNQNYDKLKFEITDKRLKRLLYQSSIESETKKSILLKAN